MQMYNRYIPQNDGSYRRNPIVTNQAKPQQKPEAPCKPQTITPAVPSFTPECQDHSRTTENAGSFLKGLLPKNLDTGDLLIIVLLLLLAGDNKDEKNSALLTLALYLFM